MSTDRPPRPDPLAVSPDSIPDKLTDRDQWVCWRYEWDTDRDKWTKTPVDVTTGRHASSTNAETWTSFDDALAYHEDVANDTDGVGFVVGENDMFAGLDLDDCRDATTGDCDEWADDVLETVETYAEVSPSGTGLRLFGLGIIPDGGTRADVEGAEGHIEMYDSGRYLTVTGHHVAETPEAVEQVNDEIGDIHAEHIADGHDGDRDSTATATASVDRGGHNPATATPTATADLTDDELLERARNAKNGDKFRRLWRGDDSDHESHSEADLALVGHLAFWTGGDRSRIDRLFRESDLYREKWDRDDYRERTIDTALTGRGSDDFYSPGGAATADGSEVVETADGDEHELPVPDSDLSIRDGGYGYWRRHEDSADEWIAVTNFQLKTQSFATDPDDPGKEQIELTVHPATGDAYDVTVPPTVFNDKRNFKKSVAFGRTTTFAGNERELNDLKRFVGTQDAPIRRGTYQMGRFGDEWVTPNGVLTADGWTDDPEHIHVSRDVGVERKWDLSPDDGDEYDAAEVAEILELLPETRDPERFIPALGWFYSTPLKSLIHEWTGQFNLLGVLGETGAGKTATLSAMWELFGMGGDPMTADDTKYVLLTTLASTNSIPMWFDEYKPSDMSSWAVDTFWNEIRKTTRGGVSARGNPDGSTTEYHLRAPTVVSGEERVHGSAEERRGIYTTLKKGPTDPGSASARAFADLMGGSAKNADGERVYYEGHDLNQHALAYQQWVLSLDESEVREAWRDAARHVSELLADHDIDGMEDLVEQGLQTIKFGTVLYRAFTDAMGGDADTITNDQIDDAIVYTATNAVGGANRKSHLDVLFEVAGRAARHGYLEEGTHYKFVRAGEADEELRLNLSTGFDKIVQYARDHDVAEDLLNSKDDYHERLDDALEAGDSYVATKSQKTPPVGRAVGVDTHRAAEAIDGFETALFADERATGGSHTTTAESGSTRLTSLSPGYQTVTVECVTTTTDTPQSMVERGVLRDESGTIDYVVWDGEPTGFEEGEAYRVTGARGGFDPDGASQLEINMDVAETESIGAGVGHVPLEASGDNERLTAEAATDGGTGAVASNAARDGWEQAEPQLLEILRENGPLAEPALLAEATGAGIDDAPAALEHLAERGRINQPAGSDEWEVRT